MRLPPDAVRSRVLWSIPAAAIVGMWGVGVLGAGVTIFPTSYTLPEVLAEIGRAPRRALWHDAFAYPPFRPFSGWFEGRPWLALVV